MPTPPLGFSDTVSEPSLRTLSTSSASSLVIDQLRASREAMSHSVYTPGGWGTGRAFTLSQNWAQRVFTSGANRRMRIPTHVPTTSKFDSVARQYQNQMTELGKYTVLG
jgi:hypothetical protein